MKLLELLVKERIEWHPEALCYTQDECRSACAYKITDPILEPDLRRVWTHEGMVTGHHIRLKELADDWQTAIVTKEQYDNACKLVDDGYTLWFGGECPVPYDTHVQVWLNDGTKGDSQYPLAKHWRWEWDSGVLNIIAYKISVAKPDGSREPIGFNCRCDSVPVVTEYPAHSFLEKGVQHMKDRAAQRDSAEGERSMAACVNAFNAMFGKDLTETQGWQFMVLLKMARSRNKFNPDDYEDGAAYTGLAGEAHSHE